MITGNSNKKKWSNKPREEEDENNSSTSSKTPNKTNGSSFEQGSKDNTCYCCGKIGHLSPECPDKNKIKKEDWHIKKATQYYMEANKADAHQDKQEEGAKKSYKSANSKNSSQLGWIGLIVEQSLYNNHRDAKDRLKNCVTLDNGSTLSLFSNPELVQNIKISSI